MLTCSFKLFQYLVRPKRIKKVIFFAPKMTTTTTSTNDITEKIKLENKVSLWIREHVYTFQKNCSYLPHVKVLRKVEAVKILRH